MIKHIVMFKMNNFEKNEEKEQKQIEIITALNALPEKISAIKFYEIGTNIKESPNAFDIVLVSEFESMEALQTYATHPEHLKAVELIKANTSNRTVVDYEI